MSATEIPPPDDADGHRRAARDAIEKAALSVHLLDAIPGAEVDGDEETSYPTEQLRLGLVYARSQMIWVPKSLDVATVEDERHRELLAELESGERGERSYDFLRVPPSDLAGDVAEKLRQLQDAARPETVPAAALLEIQRQDQVHALDLSRALAERGVIPCFGPQERDPRKNEERLKSQLAEVGAIVIVYGRVEPRWVRGRLVQAVKIATSEEYPLKSVCVYLAPPDEEKADLKARFPFLNLHPLDNRKGFDPTTLEPLFADLGVGGAR